MYTLISIIYYAHAHNAHTKAVISINTDKKEGNYNAEQSDKWTHKQTEYISFKNQYSWLLLLNCNNKTLS